jgi:hypothetical protein
MELKNSTQQPSISGLSNGPYIARVVGHNDSTRMGTLECVILRKGGAGQEIADSVRVYPRYAPHFFGYTAYEATDANLRNASSSQQSYGMWFVPPDIGTKVIIIFIEGDREQCFWLACVPEPGVNQMVPGIAASQYAELTPQEKTKLGFTTDTAIVPVVEVNKRVQGRDSSKPDIVKKAMHPFTLRLATQGLLKDPIRGTTTSSARRSTISNVYGISTPGPVVVGGKQYRFGTEKDPVPAYVEREGGTQFVMDDGYVGKDEKTKKEGIIDELVRLRTRTGHQILLHNSSDLIYICNSRGTAWLEFTSDGKIDIYAADSISIHSENDFNFRADRDINFEAGSNVNIVAAQGSMHFEASGLIEGFAGLDCNWTAANHFNASALGRVRLTSTGASTNPTQAGPLSGIDLYSVLGNINMYATTELKMQTLTEFDVKSGVATNFISGASTTFKTAGSFNVDTIGGNFIKAGGANVFTAIGSHIERATLIDMNGPTPAPISPSAATDLAFALDALSILPEAATSVVTLDRFSLSGRTADKNATSDMQKGWENNNFYAGTKISSIMRRVPTHEPWDDHENINPTAYKPEKTGRDGPI